MKLTAVSTGPGLPPVLLKIINKVELLSERLGCHIAREQEGQFSASSLRGAQFLAFWNGYNALV